MPKLSNDAPPNGPYPDPSEPPEPELDELPWLSDEDEPEPSPQFMAIAM